MIGSWISTDKYFIEKNTVTFSIGDFWVDEICVLGLTRILDWITIYCVKF